MAQKRALNFFSKQRIHSYTQPVYTRKQRSADMSVMVLDAGNSIIKAKITRRQDGEIAFPHALRHLTEAEYGRIVKRGETGAEARCVLGE